METEKCASLHLYAHTSEKQNHVEQNMQFAIPEQKMQSASIASVWLINLVVDLVGREAILELSS